MSKAEENKRIIKNTLLLYGRMFLAMIVALFTSRVVLQVIGVEDYGIRSVVGSATSIILFINGALSASTSRFITYELGRVEATGDNRILKTTFTTSFFVHLALAFIIAIILETIGLWFLENKLVIPSNRLWAARWVFHLSILGLFVSFTQVPYTASIISHERFDIYAYVEMAYIFLRLGLLYLLVILPFDKMVLFSILTFILNIGMAFYYRFFCIRHFKECHLSLSFDRGIFKRMMVFSSWNVYYNGALAARDQGVGMLMNMFFGVTANAAGGIASQVTSTIRGFANNILASIRPQITKSYAKNDDERTLELVAYSSVIIFYLMSLLMLPLIVETHYVIWLWLGIVPTWTVTFCRLGLICNLMISMCYPLLTITDAAEQNKYPCMINGTVYLFAFPICYLAFRYFHIVWFGMFYNSVTIFFSFVVYCFLVHKCIPAFSTRKHLVKFFLKNSLIMLLVLSLLLAIKQSMPQSILRLLIVCVTSTLLILASGYFIGLDKDMRVQARTSMVHFIHRLKRRRANMT